ncbi:MAG: hypothetical protein COZ05_02520 [Armatimonadetes bacterium CG_4_10_14_3_um_filter_59_10]|nr:MAG: hypothetical protein COZ05_02520 [Armatimonadetes bacterium CG_4_10_14_3_um_filter_59_10]
MHFFANSTPLTWRYTRSLLDNIPLKSCTFQSFLDNQAAIFRAWQSSSADSQSPSRFAFPELIAEPANELAPVMLSQGVALLAQGSGALGETAGLHLLL